MRTDLLNDIPLSNNSQLAFLNGVKEALEKEFDIDIRDSMEENEETDPELNQKIFIVATNANIIITHLKSGKSAKEKFVNNFKKWYDNNKEIKTKLEEIAKTIKKTESKSNTSKWIGFGSSVIGGGLLLFSAIFTPLTAGLVAPVGIAGGALLAAGASTFVAASVTEIVLVKTNIEKAQKIIKENENVFKELGEWMDHAKKLKEAESEIMSIDIVKSIIPNIKSLIEKGMEIKDNKKRTDFTTQKIREIKRRFPEISGKDAPKTCIVKLLSLLTSVLLLLHDPDCALVFGCATLTIKSITDAAVPTVRDIGVTGMFDITTSLIRGIANIAVANTFVSSGITLGSISSSLVSTSTYIDENKGFSTSHADDIINLYNQMEKESEAMYKVYKNLVEMFPRA